MKHSPRNCLRRFHTSLICALTAISTASTAVIAAARAAEPRPNILWIIAEELGPEALRCFGEPEAKTPVLDQFARDGVRYTRAYVTGPVCSVSRRNCPSMRCSARIAVEDTPS